MWSGITLFCLDHNRNVHLPKGPCRAKPCVLARVRTGSILPSPHHGGHTSTYTSSRNIHSENVILIDFFLYSSMPSFFFSLCCLHRFVSFSYITCLKKIVVIGICTYFKILPYVPTPDLTTVPHPQKLPNLFHTSNDIHLSIQYCILLNKKARTFPRSLFSGCSKVPFF